MGQVKLKITLWQGDVEALDRFVAATGAKNRSAAIRQAIHQLPDPALEDAYAAAWSEWERSGDARQWEATTADA